MEGSAKNLGGKIKEAAGKVTGDEKLKREGQTDQVAGKVQNVVGGIKDKIRERDDEKTIVTDDRLRPALRGRGRAARCARFCLLWRRA